MRRERFQKLCLLASILGLGVLYVSTQFLTPEEVAPREIDRSMLGEQVRSTGTVENFYTADSTSFFDLQGVNGSVMVVDFEGGRFSTGERVSVTGTVRMYEGELELVSTEIERK